MVRKIQGKGKSASVNHLKKKITKRTNGPVNAHLVSGPSISTKYTKP